MDSSKLKSSSTSSSAGQSAKRPRPGQKQGDQLALPLSDQERKASRKQLDQLHPGNRLRLMFGQPLLPQDNPEEESAS